ncbi:MAG: hypothetical protein M1836_003325 [Candelina mexicana]|nr:MAG: hypothetical protein M1836_003325 [Candelina mexicana]
MPAIRLTIALNSKQSQKAPLLIPSSISLAPESKESCRSLILKATHAKLRLKKASRIYVAGTGKELLSEDDWKTALKDDITLLVSAGEDYIGLKKEAGSQGAQSTSASRDCPNALPTPPCAISILAKTAQVDPLSLTQVETTAHTLPGLILAVAQPDLHPGTKFPIGAVFVSEQWIHPPLIGGDVGCGMAWYRTRLSRASVEGDKGRRVAEKLRGLEGAWKRQLDRKRWLSDGGEGCSAGEEWDRSLGTIGAGNHFAEIQVVESASSAASDKDGALLAEGDVILLVHSGSRGYGGDILKRYTTDGKYSLHKDDPKASEYLLEHDRACEWAQGNRDLIALRFLSCLEPGEAAWDLGRNEGNSNEPTAEEIQTARANIKQRKVVDIWHNNVERTLWPPLPPLNLESQAATLSLHPEQPEQYPVYIHRKGAAPTYFPRPLSKSPNTNETRLPAPTPLSILPLPGSRGTPTLILHPTFSTATGWGHTNALSLAHGAGRSMSRAKAATYISRKYKGRSEDLLRGDTPTKIDSNGNKHCTSTSSHGNVRGEYENGGAWIVCEDKQLVWEEAPEAYKDVWEVCADLERERVAECVGWCRAVVSYKIRNE